MPQDTSFTDHNIELDDGSLTYPRKKLTMKEYPLFLSSKRLLDLMYPGERTGIRLVDLACLEGGYATEFARLGFEVVGIEVRKSNFDNCQYVKEHVNLPNLNFVNDNILNLEQYGIFDVVFCSGILYHLNKPKAFIEVMSKCCKKLLIINTHYSTELKNIFHKLSDEASNESLLGRWFIEHEESESIELQEQKKWSSWENRVSFWIRREYLIQAIRDVGFDMVFEQYDGIGENIGSKMISIDFQKYSRGTFVGIKL